jgi:hypothetical protein
MGHKMTRRDINQLKTATLLYPNLFDRFLLYYRTCENSSLAANILLGNLPRVLNLIDVGFGLSQEQREVLSRLERSRDCFAMYEEALKLNDVNFDNFLLNRLPFHTKFRLIPKMLRWEFQDVAHTHRVDQRALYECIYFKYEERMEAGVPLTRVRFLTGNHGGLRPIRIRLARFLVHPNWICLKDFLKRKRP